MASPRQATSIGGNPATAPIPAAVGRPAWRDTFVSLKVPNFRWFAASHLVAVSAMWMQRIAQDWLVFELSGSATAVGVTVALQFAPMLLLGPYGGIIADRYSKRLIMIIAQALTGLMAALMAVLALTGAIQVWHIYCIALVLGLIVVVDNPARHVFVNELVGPQHLRNAISVNSSIFQLGGMLGPAIGGILIGAVGGGWAFAINAAACLYTIITLAILNTSQFTITPSVPKGKGQLREGIRYAVKKPAIFWSSVIGAFVAVFAMSSPVLMVAFADKVFHTGATGYGLLNTLTASGALAGALASTRRRTLRLRSVIGSAGAFGVMMALSAFAPTMWLFSALMVCVGFCCLLFLVGANQLVQMSSHVRIRGRVMSLYVMILIGGQAIGGPMIGWLAENAGPHATIFIAGAVPAAASAVIAVILARRGNLMLQFSLRRGSHPVSIVRRPGTASFDGSRVDGGRADGRSRNRINA